MPCSINQSTVFMICFLVDLCDQTFLNVLSSHNYAQTLLTVTTLFSNVSTYFRNVDSSQNNRCQHTHISEICSNVIKRFQCFQYFQTLVHTCSTMINCFPKVSNGSVNGSLKCSLNGSLEGSLNCSLNCSLKCSLKRSLTYSINGQLQLQGSERLLNVC